jgi:hypothetical protein
LKITLDDKEVSFSYLSINGNALTFDTAVEPKSAITGPITSSGYTDRMNSRNSKELAVNFTVANVSGTSPTLALYFLVLDPMEPSNGTTGVPPPPLPPAVVTLPLTGSGGVTSAPTTIRLVITNGQAAVWVNGTATDLGAMNVPMVWQVELVVGGSNPGPNSSPSPNPSPTPNPNPNPNPNPSPSVIATSNPFTPSFSIIGTFEERQ